MRVGIEKRYLESYKLIVDDANRLLKGRKTLDKSGYGKTISSRETTIEKKKAKLAKALHDLILHTFSADIKKRKAKTLRRIKNNVSLIRAVIHKLKDINNYLEDAMLAEMGVIKKSLTLKALGSRNPEKFLENQRGLPKAYIRNIEDIVSRLMHEIIFFDEKLLKGYRQREMHVIQKEKLQIKDLEHVLRAQTALLDALEAKIPPESKVRMKLLSRETFNRWVPYMFALLASFDAEHNKEKLIFSRFSGNRILKRSIGAKIKHIVKEKEKMLKLREKRESSMSRISDDYRRLFHDYISASGL